MSVQEGLDPDQLLIHVVRPTLATLGLPGGVLAEKLLLGTAAQESNFRCLHQLGNGPALSLWQIEPVTARDTIERCPAALRLSIFRLLPSWDKAPSAESVITQLPGNLYLGAALCRIVYYMKPFSSWSVPSYVMDRLRTTDLDWCAGTWKHFYNTPRGAGTENEFIENWVRFGLHRLWRDPLD